MNFSLAPTTKALWSAGLLLIAVTAFYNVGIIAVDDYANGIELMVPAQNQRPFLDVARDSVHPPIPKLILQSLARIPLFFGIQNPITQLRFSLLFIGLFIYLITTISMLGWFRESEKSARWGLGLLAFYFACPLFLSRPMIETLSLPFLALSGFFAVEYWKNQRLPTLLLSLSVLALGSLLRFQIGVCALALLALPLILNQYRHLAIAVGCGVLLALAAGIPDIAIHGKYHHSLYVYLDYNIHHSAEGHGRSPFWVYTALFLALSLPPTFLARFKMDWRCTYRPLLPLLLYFLVFLVSHSLIAHKEERFMIPIIPFFLALLVPLFQNISQAGKKWRLYYFGGLNLVLLILTSFNVPQNNLVKLAGFLNEMPQVKILVSNHGTFPFFPLAFVTHPVEVRQVETYDLHRFIACDTLLVVPKPLLDSFKPHTEAVKVGEFSPGPLEALFVKLNPKKNARRGTLVAFYPPQCPQVSP